jgi:hypothetical protein
MPLAHGQQQPPARPQAPPRRPAPAPAPAPAAREGTLQLVTDAKCRVKVDGGGEIPLQAGGSASVKLAEGEHVIQVFVDERVVQQKTARISGGGQTILLLSEKDFAVPKPAEEKKTSPPAAALLIRADAASRITVDGKETFELKAGESRVVGVSLGEHLVAAEAIGSADRWEQVVTVERAGQQMVPVRLDEAIEKRRAAEAAQRAAEEEATRQRMEEEKARKIAAKLDEEQAAEKRAREAGRLKLQERLRPLEGDWEGKAALNGVVQETTLSVRLQQTSAEGKLDIMYNLPGPNGKESIEKVIRTNVILDYKNNKLEGSVQGAFADGKQLVFYRNAELMEARLSLRSASWDCIWFCKGIARDRQLHRAP